VWATASRSKLWVARSRGPYPDRVGPPARGRRAIPRLRSGWSGGCLAVFAAAALASAAAGAPARAALLGAAAGAGGALLLGAWSERGRREPLQTLRRFAAAVAAGDLGRRLRGDWEPILRGPFEAVDSMAGALSRRVRESDARRAQLEAVIGAMEEGVLVVDREARVVLANPRLRELFGSPSDLVGRPLLEVVRSSEASEVLSASLREAAPQATELSIGPGSGRRVRVQVAPFPLDAAPEGAVAVFHDVTDLRRLEVMRRDFVANASHELKTPLTAIRGFAERLADAKLEDPAAVRSVDAILSNTRRLAALVEDLLELSRIESGSAPLELETVDAPGVARRLLAELEPRLRGRELDARVEATGTVLARADRRALEQVLLNLLDNAIKYTPAGGSIAVSARSVPERRRVRIEVADTGIGVPAKHLPRIFERFYRVDPGRSRALGGTGLGLAIVKHWVQALGGEIGVESHPGRGSRFWVELPAADVPTPAA
jgi:two-component system, OmpR family, phosphate regulon sensor histidine kinase PhoR